MFLNVLVAPLAATELVEPVAGGLQLVLAALVGIGLIVGLITWAKIHPFLALIIGGLSVGIVAGVDLADVIVSFSTGFGETAAGVGILIALGAMFAKLLADSGGADEIVDAIVGTRQRADAAVGDGRLVGAIIGLPMFFEIGLVLLMPVIYLVARRAQLSLIAIGIPALAGLSAMHGLVPPHPGPLIAIDTLDADLGTTLALGVLVAIPTVVRLRTGVRAVRRPLGAGGGSGPVRGPRLRGDGAAAVVPHHAGYRAAARGADDGQGAGRHHPGRRGGPSPPSPRRARYAR